MRLRAALTLAAFLAAGAVRAHAPAPPAAVEFQPPPAGSYALPAIQASPEGDVLDLQGRPRALSEFTRGRFTVLGLVYTRCADPEGCPRATWAFNEVRQRLRERPALEPRVRLVTLSFDPAHDTPAVMRAYARRMGIARSGADWQLLTTRSRSALGPILEGFGQDLRVESGSRAKPGTEAFTHTLKVFLIDPAGQVREIYSTAYLVPEVVVNDLATLAAEPMGTVPH